ncbi:MAG: hydroxylamine reductase, partial [Clostridiales bacterium]|nr:hydroxylamine reductase [Clostridiales bacterium]
MSKNMFCFQCEQTAGCAGCTGKMGVCGKSADVAGIQDRLTGALIGLGHAAKGNEGKLTDETHRLVI